MSTATTAVTAFHALINHLDRDDPLFWAKRDLLTNIWDEDCTTCRPRRGRRGQVAYWRANVHPDNLKEFDVWVADNVAPHYPEEKV